MKIIALESSALTASTAIMEDGLLTAEYTVNYKLKHSKTLLSMLDEIARMTELDLKTVDGIAISAGPGSFTGLRIGSATAKGIGLVLDKPLIEVPTLEALAYDLFRPNALICPIMDARREQVYNGIYRFEGDDLITIEDQRALGVDELCAELDEDHSENADLPVIFLGDGAAVFKNKIDELLKRPHSFAPAHLSTPRAASVASLGLKYLKEGKTVSAADHAPTYLRKSQAERVRDEKAAAEKIDKTVYHDHKEV